MPRACGDSINAVYWQKYQGAIWQEQTESEAEQTMWEKIKYGLSQMAARGCACMLAVLVLVAAGSTDSYGAGKSKDSSVIESIAINFKTTFGEPEEIPDPEITMQATGCSLGDIQFMTDYDRWNPGKKVRVDITVEAEEGKVFPTSLNRTQCKVTGASFVSAKALDNTHMQVRVDYIPVTVLGKTESAGWSKMSHTRAVWKSVDFAPGYSLILYCDDKVVKRTTSETASIDLSEYMKDENRTYYYEVKAIPVSSDDKKYFKEGEFVTSTDQVLDWEDTPEGQESINNSGASGDGGSIKGNNYVLPDGTKERNKWKKVSGQWYFFDEDGNMVRGWRNIGGFWYYMAQDGSMQTGWVNPDGSAWYYLNDNGEMCTGWIQPEPGVWYHMDASGHMQYGWVAVDGKWYYMGGDGKMLTGWTQVAGVWYYLHENGSMAANTTIDGWYIGADGVAQR